MSLMQEGIRVTTQTLRNFGFRMGRRKKTGLIDLQTLLLVAIGLLIVTFQQHPAGFVLLMVVAAGIVIFFRIFLPKRVRRSVNGKINPIITDQMDNLVRRRAQLIRQDAYGKTVSEKWDKEVDYFITSQLYPSLTASEQRMLVRELGRITTHINRQVETASLNNPILRTFSDQMTPTEFEEFCAEQLQLAGWNARVTQRSRDQGVDVIAEKSGVRLVLQCKLYANPVGNKAVQEVAAGWIHEHAHYGVVVTNTRYTPSAEQLASTTGVFLLHYSDLPKIELLLKPSVVRP